MNLRIWAVIRSILIVWGGISLVVAVVAFAFVVFSWGPGNRDAADNVSAQDVRFVLNWSRLGEERIEKVVHSFESMRSMSGDHLDAYAIKITHVSTAELTRVSERNRLRWHRGDDLAHVVDDALAFASGWLHRDEIFWFPKESELRSQEMFVLAWSVDYGGIEPRAAQLIFVNPSQRMVYYLSARM